MSTASIHRQIADELRRDVLSGALQPGAAVPSEYELSVRFNTTRNTVRKGLAILKMEGVLVSEQGRRTVVRPRPNLRFNSTGVRHRAHRETGLPNFTAEIRKQGRQAEQRIIEVAEVSAPPDIAERFGVDPGSPVIVRRRLFLVDEEPMQLCDGYYLPNLVVGTMIAERKKIKGGVHRLIEAPEGPIKRRLVQFVEDLEIRMPTPDEADVLRIGPDIPLARTLRTAFDSRGDVVEVLDSSIPGDRYTFRYVIDIP